MNVDIPGQGSFGKMQRGEMCHSSGSSGKLQRCVESQLERTRSDNHNMQISDCRYVDKVLNIASQLFFTRCEEQRYFLGINVDNDEVSSSCRGSTPKKHSVAYRNTNSEELKTLFDSNVEADRGTVFRHPECIYDEIHFLSWHEIYSL